MLIPNTASFKFSLNLWILAIQFPWIFQICFFLSNGITNERTSITNRWKVERQQLISLVSYILSFVIIFMFAFIISKPKYFGKLLGKVEIWWFYDMIGRFELVSFSIIQCLDLIWNIISIIRKNWIWNTLKYKIMNNFAAHNTKDLSDNYLLILLILFLILRYLFNFSLVLLRCYTLPHTFWCTVDHQDMKVRCRINLLRVYSLSPSDHSLFGCSWIYHSSIPSKWRRQELP